ncbi:hypothetical protein N8J89_23580 [Crossiella sp. CA-258035]|uniref:hypothetical protein n=1 Tax=Crossiella sp. CA-258035 TaxID=2981138 RepID=UPI0024BC45C3|nr:hypothetical protein [Crossiella sp. CA-258035]WHT16113.1 hypothetical protein N8J89_23580 [Crossiella sp. CA-258035]
MDTFQNWTQNIEAPVAEFATPKTLAELCQVVREAEAAGLPVHAVGSAWAYSAPAHCEGVVVRTEALSGFPAALQAAIGEADAGGRLLLAVGGGITIRNLSLALDGKPRPDGRSGPPAELLRGRRWTLPTLGGSGGQSLAGAVGTGTHGGDAARPPIGDYLHALLLVGSGGQVTLVQRTAVVEVNLLRDKLIAGGELPEGTPVRELRGDAALDAAVLSLGRFGVVHSVVLEVHDETEVALVEHRRAGTWRALAPQLAAEVDRAVAGDEYLEVLINPVTQGDGDRKCLLSTRKSLPRTELPVAGRAFGLGDQASTPVMDERARASLPPELGQALCAKELPQPLAEVAKAMGLSLDRRLGDVLADLLNLTTTIGLPHLVELATSAVTDSVKPARRPSDNQPWLVHGTRWEVGDFFDYNADCYRMDFAELFFPADADLTARVDGVLGVFETLRAQGIALGGYVSLRFLRGSRALLAPAPFERSCAIEVAMLRGLVGNRKALTLLHELAVRHGGRLHWGQLNELDSAGTTQHFGPALTDWRRELTATEGDSTTFSTPFTRLRGLETNRPADWTLWTDGGIRAGGPPALAGNQVFVTDSARIVHTTTAIGGDWRPVRPEPVGAGARVVVLPSARRLELLVADATGRVLRSRQQDDGGFPRWESLAGEGIDGDPAGAAHADGRLELFARGDFPRQRKLMQAWAHWPAGPWSGLMGVDSGRLGGPPSVCGRSFNGSDQLVVVAAGSTGYVRWSAQTGPGGASGWTRWQELGNQPGSHPLAFRGPDGVVRVVVADPAGRVFEAIELTGELAVRWQPWRALPAGPRLDPTTGLTGAGSWLLGLGRDGRLLGTHLDQDGWSAWQDLGGALTGPLAASAGTDGVLVTGVRRGDGRLVYRRLHP